jgi:hypothetical protein
MMVSYVITGKRYQSFPVLPIRALHQAADRLFGNDSVRPAAHRAVTWNAAEGSRVDGSRGTEAVGRYEDRRNVRSTYE